MEKIEKKNKEGKELTRYAFISHTEAYLKQLLKNPKTAQIDEFLKSFGLKTPQLLKLLLKRAKNDDVDSAILIRKESIKNGKVDDKGNREKDTFVIKYKVPRKDYTKKMRNLYISLFENYRCDNPLLLEDGEGSCCDGGATSADASGQYSKPLFGKPIKRKICITEEQLAYIQKKMLEEDSPAVTGIIFGDLGFDAPGLDIKNDPSLDHKNMFEKSKQKKIRK